MATTTEQIEDIFRIIGEAISVEPEEFQDHETWKYHGLSGLLATATASDIQSQAEVGVALDVFDVYPTIGEFRRYLGLSGGQQPAAPEEEEEKEEEEEEEDAWNGIPPPKVPLSIVLQGSIRTATTVLFLFPDGSGAGTSYGTLPAIGDGICVIGLNSPFLRRAQNFTCSIERMARLWLAEVRKLQPPGLAYVLGGWSAGGYYCYEMAKLLTAAGEKVARLILIDSPCRLQYEALPVQVVGELTTNGLMGSSGLKKAPEWLVQHFTSTVISVDGYMPTALATQHVPALVNFVWVEQGLVESIERSGLRVDVTVKVTRFLLEPRGKLESEGWEKLLPGALYSFDYMTGNHFQITQPPHVRIALLSIARSIAGDRAANIYVQSDSLGGILQRLLSKSSN
jgi:thioesterase domain-containing protein